MGNKLKWRFDISTFRLLGRDLITDPIAALFELVKNAYDANAENVKIEFIGIETISDNSKIIIADDGIGMSIEDIDKKWMVIGTNSKRKELYSPEPYKRRYVGEKGIGRFAVDKLGQYVRIRTKRKQDEKELVVTINWQTYQNLAEGQQTSLNFTDIENEYEWAEPTFIQGTILEIYQPREAWDVNDIFRVEKELSRLISPFQEAKYLFNISVKAADFSNYTDFKIVDNNETTFASHSFKLEYDINTQEQDSLYFDSKQRKVSIKKIPKPSFGFVKFYLYYFDSDAKARFNAHYKDTSANIDGIKIYRDGILTTPFAEYESQDEKRRDILGINKRRWRATFDRMGTRDCIGFIEITKEGNPNIIDSTSRQQFLQTNEYSDLKDFIYEQLDTFMKTRKVEREEKTKENLDSFEFAKAAMVDILKQFKNSHNPKTEQQQKEITKTISKQLPIIEQGLKNITIEYQEAKKEEARKEKIYFSLMSLSTFAANIAHAVRTSIASIKDDATYLNNKVTGERLTSKSARIIREIERLLKMIDFMLKYARTDYPSDNFNVKDSIQTVFDAHESIFEQQHIEIILNIEQNLILYGNQIFFQDIITNLISNSIKALEGTFGKKISCICSYNKTEMTLLFSDNGIGIPLSKREWVFQMYNTTTQNQGGAGLGLYIVKTNIESFNGSISIEDNKDNIGICFKLTIPFKK